MYLINAMVFDAEWKEVYSKGDIYQGQFTSWDGTKQTADFMRSEESYYLDDGRATGFIKPYFDDKYSFVALLPNEGIKIEDYIADLTGEGLLNTVSSAEPATVSASLPKFSYEYEITLNDVLKSMGMTDGFNPVTADFKRLGSSPIGNIYIGEVLHKTFISLDELGTKAGAVTKVEMKVESAILDLKIVTLDRPFVYAIIDNATAACFYRNGNEPDPVNLLISQYSLTFAPAIITFMTVFTAGACFSKQSAEILCCLCIWDI